MNIPRATHLLLRIFGLLAAGTLFQGCLGLSSEDGASLVPTRFSQAEIASDPESPSVVYPEVRFDPPPGSVASLPAFLVATLDHPVDPALLYRMATWKVHCTGSGLYEISDIQVSGLAVTLTLHDHVTALPGESCRLSVSAIGSDLKGSAVQLTASATYGATGP